MINKVIICGKLVSNPILKNNYCRVNFELKEEFLDKQRKQVSKTTLHPVSFGGSVAESFVIAAKEGDIILIEGKMIINEYLDTSGSQIKEYRIFSSSYKILSSAKDLKSPEIDDDFEDIFNNKSYESYR